jgi:type IV pilus assembly protein PilP
MRRDTHSLLSFPELTRRFVGLALVALMATGCVSRDKRDLEKFTAEVLARPGGRIEPLPPIKPYQRYLYQAAEKAARDPFQSTLNAQPEKEVAVRSENDAEQQAFNDEIASHNREELEGFELDSLRMVGTLQNDAELWGIVQDSAGTVHRVQVGNYIGRNFGKILDIQEDRINVREVVKDADGRWDERQANLALFDEESPE